MNEIRLPERANTQCFYSGLDHIDRCRDKQHFLSYSHSVEYVYNSQGFRDTEWPTTDTDRAVWCLGDSFTVGVGSPQVHTWPHRLSTTGQHRTVNVSMDGASNEWIARRCCDVYRWARPKNIVIMWSYLHRREAQQHINDIDRRVHYVRSSVAEDFENFEQCRNSVKNCCAESNLIEFIIPGWEPGLTQLSWNNVRDPAWPELVQNLKTTDTAILTELQQLHGIDVEILAQQLLLQDQIFNGVIQVPQLDLARDGHHFDVVTSDWVVNQILPRLT